MIVEPVTVNGAGELFPLSQSIIDLVVKYQEMKKSPITIYIDYPIIKVKFHLEEIWEVDFAQNNIFKEILEFEKTS